MKKITAPKQLEEKSLQLRIEVIEMLEKANSGHVAGAFSMADLMTALYYNVAKIDPEKPHSKDRDYVLVSNGHTCPIWYAILADLGFFEKKELNHLRETGHLLQGHPVLGIPGVENSSGPLGHGLSQAVGIAIGLKMDRRKNRVFCFVSDSEHEEGQIWEAVMSAAKFGLDNLIVIVDKNGIQIDGTTSRIMPLGNLSGKYKASGWEVIEIDGHNPEHIIATLNMPNGNGKPRVIIARTIAGKDVNFMENNPLYHEWKGNPGEAENAIKQLTEKINHL